LLETLRPPTRITPWTIGGRPFAWGTRTFVMGILNVTPDSFSDGGEHVDPATCLAYARRMRDEGADLIDVGGESTRPGSRGVPLEVELQRVLPVIRALADEPGLVLSIDTSKPGVAEAAIRTGAHLVNDVTGLREAAMRDTVARLRVPAIAMHMQGTPETMQRDPRYGDVVAEVRDALGEALDRAHAAGIGEIALDPGIGFGKTDAHNLELLRNLGTLRALGAPVVVGSSRKGFIGRILDVPVDERLEGNLAVTALAIQAGADVTRVHDVAPSVRAARMADAWVRGRADG